MQTLVKNTPSLETGILYASASEAKEIIKMCYRMLHNNGPEKVMIKSVYLHGQSGTAKSSIIDQAAKELSEELGLNMENVYLDLSSKESIDFRGLIYNKDGKTSYLLPAELPTSGFGFIVGDEVTRSEEQVRNPYQDLALSGRIGEYKLPPGYMVVSAGNDTDRGVTPTSVAFNTRTLHVYVVLTIDEWLIWAANNGIHPMVQKYLQLNPDKFHKFDPKAHTQPNARVWHAVSDWTYEIESDPANYNDAVALLIYQGLVGYGIACEVAGFVRMGHKTPDPRVVLLDPENAEVPKEPSILYALISALARLATKGNFSTIFKYLNRCPQEFKVAAIKLIVQREKRDENKAVAEEKNVQKHDDIRKDLYKNSITQTNEFSKFIVDNQNVFL